MYWTECGYELIDGKWVWYERKVSLSEPPREKKIVSWRLFDRPVKIGFPENPEKLTQKQGKKRVKKGNGLTKHGDI